MVDLSKSGSFYLDCLYHGIRLNDEELQCCDEANPRTGKTLPRNEIELVVKESDWYGTTRRELMAFYKETEFEINLCEGCYETVICKLLLE